MEETKVDETFIKLMDEYRTPKDKDMGLIEACSKSPIIFSERMLGLKPYSWQVKFLHSILQAINGETDDREFVAITSRQIGKSTAVAILALWMAVFNKRAGTVSNNTQVGIISASDVQAKKLLNEMKKLMRIGDTFMRTTYVEDKEPMFGSNFFTDLVDEHEANNTTTITFKPYNEEVHGEYLLVGSKNGSTIKSYPPTAIVLGETFSLIVVDEAGKSERITDQFFYDYLQPTGNATDGIYIYTSTPWVSSGFFYRMVDPDDIYGEYHIQKMLFTIDAIEKEAPDYHDKIKKKVQQMSADGKGGEVQRAYYCRFVKGEKSYFDPDNVFDMFDASLKERAFYTGPCDLGVDFGGQVTSRTVLTVSTLDDKGKAVRLYCKTYNVSEDDTLIEDIADLFNLFNIQRIIPDDCPAGAFLIRRMIDKGWEVEPMNFRSEKTKKYGAFRSMLNKGLIKSYPDEELKTEMLALEIAEGRRQSNIQHAPGYTDDLIDSFLLSTYFYIEDEEGFKIFDYTEDYDTSDDPVCPKCGSENVIMSEDKRKKKVNYDCQECGNQWIR